MKPIQIYPASRLKELPPVDWLIEGLIPAGGMAMLFGASGVGKSFVALDMALSVTSATPWLSSREVKAGPALYLPFEGMRGLGQRLVAWEMYHRAMVPDTMYYAVDYSTLQHPGPTADLIGGIKEYMKEPPKLLVIDTLSRAMVGAEENSAKDANLAMSHLDRLRAETGTAVLILHHTTKYTDVERGSTAIRAACDTVLLLKAEGDGLVLSVDKQRDAEPSASVHIYFHNSANSVVLTPTPHAADHTTNELRQVLDLLTSVQIGTDAVPYTVWRTAAEERNISLVAFRKRVGELVEKGYVEKEGNTARAAYRRLALPPGDRPAEVVHEE